MYKMEEISIKLVWSMKLQQEQVGYGQKKSNDKPFRIKGESYSLFKNTQ